MPPSSLTGWGRHCAWGYADFIPAPLCVAALRGGGAPFHGEPVVTDVFRHGGLMRRLPIVITGLILGLEESAFSQGSLDGYPFDTPSDPRSVAMGESFVGVPSNPSALMYNPAGLAGLAGMHLSYSQRKLSPGDNGTLRSISAELGTSIGTFGARFDRDSYDANQTVDAVWGVTGANAYDYDVAIGYGVSMGKGFSVGASAKHYDDGGYVPVPWYGISSLAGPINLFDVGLMYTPGGFQSQGAVEDSITLGMSVQNIGSTPARNRPPGYAYPEHLYPAGVPGYILMGFSYALRVVPRKSGAPAPLQAVLSGEYWVEPTQRGMQQLSLGLECTIDEILTLRIGGPTSIGDGTESLVYGLGLRLPVDKLGFNVSLQAAVLSSGPFSVFSIDVQIPGLSL